MQANPSQKMAIESIEGNILVNAGAGTGKTKVLVDRFIEILERGQLEKNKEVESIVAITFTKKAAEEMKERIRLKLREKFSESPDYHRYYRDMERANISTIHSFCGGIVRENAVRLGLDPLFNILDTDRSKKLLEEAVASVALEYMEGNQVFYQLLYKLGLDQPRKLYYDLMKVYGDIRNTGLDIEDLEELIRSSLESKDYGQDYIQEVKDMVEHIGKNRRANANIHKLKDDKDYLRFKEGNFHGTEDLVNLLVYIKGFFGNKKGFEDEFEAMDKIINFHKSLLEGENLDYYLVLVEILARIDQVYGESKKAISGLDYDDLQIYASRLLDQKDIREFYQDRYAYIMIDEFQDTDELQKNIFYKLSSRENKLDLNKLFLVGDPKQSIYGFRGADLEVFYRVADDIASLEEGKLIYLDDNYRTREKLMDFLNYLYSNIMGDRYQALRSNIKSDKNLEVEILMKEDLDIPKDESPSYYNMLYEADLIAKRIKILVEEEGYSYGDIALLFRFSSNMNIYEDALRRYGIGFYNLSGSGFFEKVEVRDLINAFKSIYNPQDMISSLAFLRSPMIGLSDEDIYYVLRSQGDILSRLRSSLLINPQEEARERLLASIELYEDLLELRRRKTSYELLEALVEKTHYRELLLMMEDGKQAYANVLKLLNIFKAYQDDYLDRSINILDYIDELEGQDESQANVESSDSNLVELMTIHKSKGLEFPVVILAEMSLYPRPNSSKLNFNPQVGLGLDIGSRNANYNKISSMQKLREEEEEERVLYVAMTRAEELLILGNQGYSIGFKQVVKDYLSQEHCSFIESLDWEESKEEGLLDLDSEILNHKSSYRIDGILDTSLMDKRPVLRSSISHFMDFKSCPRKYYYKHIKEIPDLALDILWQGEPRGEESSYLDPISKGNVVHKFCQDYRLGLAKEEVLKSSFDHYGLSYKEAREEVEPYIDNFIKTYREDAEEIHREKLFYYSLDKVIFTGVIDRIDLDGDSLRIIDYKTNKIGDRQVIYNMYKDQIRFYGAVVQSLYKDRARELRGELLLLETGELLEIDMDARTIDRTREELKEFVYFINNNSGEEAYPRQEKACDYCSFRNICYS